MSLTHFVQLSALIAVSAAQTCSDAAICAHRVGLSLVQTRQETEKIGSDLLERASASANIDAGKVAAHMNKFLESPNNVGQALSDGLAVINRVLPLLTDNPPQIGQAFSEFGTGLLAALVRFCSEEVQESEAFLTFKDVFQETASNLPAVVVSVNTAVTKFSEEGDVSALMASFSTGINELVAVSTRVLPEDVSAVVTKYLGAIEDGLEGFDAAMDAYTNGNIASAIEAVYSGIRVAATDLLPEDVVNDQVFQDIAGTVDAVFKDLSSIVLRFQQQLLKSNVCWKEWTGRDRVRPDQCPQGFHWDGEQFCFSGGTGLVQLDGASRGKRPRGAIPARCKDSGDFNVKIGAWCYKACPAGTETAGRRCKSACSGAYPIDSRLMCGKAKGTIAAAMWEMTTRTLRGVFSLGMLANSDTPTSHLNGTAQSLIDMGVGFTHPTCPSLGSQ